MICPNCGSENKDDVSFCANCGQRFGPRPAASQQDMSKTSSQNDNVSEPDNNNFNNYSDPNGPYTQTNTSDNDFSKNQSYYQDNPSPQDNPYYQNNYYGQNPYSNGQQPNDYYNPNNGGYGPNDSHFGPNNYNYGPNNYNPNGGYQQNPYQNQGGREPFNGMAIASLVIGIISVIPCCLFPYIGIPLNIVGLVLGIISRRKPFGRGMAIAGIVLNIIFLVFATVWLIVVLYIYVNIPAQSVYDAYQNFMY